MEKRIQNSGDALELVAPCLFGLESFVKNEIKRLGYETLSVTDGRVVFAADEVGVARSNLWLRCAERVLIRLGEFHADSFDALFEGTRALPWERFITKDGSFPVTGHALKSKLFSVPDCQAIVKKAVASRLGEKYGVKWLPETGARYPISFLIMNDFACLMLDTSGDGLHKRGYREKAVEAPLRETLAAAMIFVSRFKAGMPFMDPFCGSGTIAIEAALWGKNIAPGLRRNFLAEQWDSLDKDAFNRAREEALSLIRPGDFTVTATDIDPAAVALTQKNAHLAGVSRHIRAGERDARSVTTTEENGVLVCNPPYGDRLSDIAGAERLYREMGPALRALPGWNLYFLSSNEDFEQHFGEKAKKKRKLYNGMKQCWLYQYYDRG